MQNRKQAGGKKEKKEEKRGGGEREMESIQILTENKSAGRIWNAQIILGFRVDKVIKKEKGGVRGGRKKKTPLVLFYTLRLWERGERRGTGLTGAAPQPRSKGLFGARAAHPAPLGMARLI